MKRAFLISVQLLLILNIYAATFKSNVIGQKLGEYNSDSEYYLIEKADQFITEKQLYKNDELIKETIIETIENTKTITTNNFTSLNIKTYSNNLIISEVEGNNSIIYNYSDKQLESKIISQNNVISEINKYYYSNENKLAGILKIINDEQILITFDITSKSLSSNISNSIKYKKSQIHNGVINSEEYDKDNLLNKIDVERIGDDEIILTQNKNNNIVREYYSDGLLNKKETYNQNNELLNSYEFFYDENYFKTSEKFTENIFNQFTNGYDIKRESISTYKNNNLQEVKISENGILISSYYFNDKKDKIENIYENGKVYCTIIYRDDKIFDILYREVNDDL